MINKFHSPVSSKFEMLVGSGALADYTHLAFPAVAKSRRYEFDPLGYVLVEERPGVKTTNTFDPCGRMLTTRHERGTGKDKAVASRRYTFNVVCDCLNMVDENNQTTSYSYNNVDWLTSVQYPEGQKN